MNTAETSDPERAWSLAKSRPGEALKLADQLLSAAADSTESTLARAARGRAHYELGNNDQAVVDMSEALKTAADPFRSRLVVALAAAVSAGGDAERATTLLNEITAPDSASDPIVRALASSQLGLLQLHAGEMTAAAALLEESVRVLVDEPDEQDGLARILGNAGYCQLALGNLDRSSELFGQAAEIAWATNQHMLVAGCLQNQACVKARLGELPAALDLLDQSRRMYTDTGDPTRNLSTLFDDMADIHRIAGLTQDAVQYAKEALRGVENGGNIEKLADATYRLSVCELDNGDLQQAGEHAMAARSLFQASGRPLWERRASLLSLEAIKGGRSPDAELVDSAHRAVAHLDQAGWQTEALQLRNRMVRIGMDLEQPALVDDFLIDDLPANDQSVVGQLESLYHRSQRNLRRNGLAGTAIEEGRQLLRHHQQQLGDPELRAGASRLARDFHQLALAEVMDRANPATVLETEERWRATSQDLPRARPPDDPAVAQAATELKEHARQIAETEDRNGNEQDRRKLRALEEGLRRASLRSSGITEAQVVEDVPALEVTLRSKLGGRHLVEWFEYRGKLHGIQIGDGVERIWSAGDISTVQSRAARIRRDLARLLRMNQSPQELEKRWLKIVDNTAVLRDALFSGASDGASGYVLSPPGALQELPWQLLIPIAGPAVTITISATSWLQPDEPVVDPRLGVVIGPELEYASTDSAEVGGSFSTTPPVQQSTIAGMKQSIEQADVLHVAAHGTFRPDSPRFSSVQLADGPFALYELEAFDRVPSLVTLAACDAGRNVYLKGSSEQLGAAPAWLTAGVNTVVAPICAVPDRETSLFVRRFYDHVPGSSPAEAIAATWKDMSDESPAAPGNRRGVSLLRKRRPNVHIGNLNGD